VEASALVNAQTRQRQPGQVRGERRQPHPSGILCCFDAGGSLVDLDHEAQAGPDQDTDGGGSDLGAGRQSHDS
jgi:hypothetical protein